MLLDIEAQEAAEKAAKKAKAKKKWFYAILYHLVY
jgi:hypothetical protein